MQYEKYFHLKSNDMIIVCVFYLIEFTPTGSVLLCLMYYSTFDLSVKVYSMKAKWTNKRIAEERLFPKIEPVTLLCMFIDHY